MFNGFLDIILLAALAVFIGIRFYNVLGRKDLNHDIKTGNIVPFPDGKGEKIIEVPFEELPDDYEEMKKKHGAQLADKIRELRKYDPAFSEKSFISGAKKAFEMILKAFSKGDGKTLKPLLSDNIYNSFIAEIAKREESGKMEDITLVAILSSDIKDIILNKKQAKVAVEIVSEQINITKNKKGEILEGDPSRVDKIAEVWTFARNLASSNPNWQLVATAGAA